MTPLDQTQTVASTSAIRAQFPALERIHNENPVAYFDGPGGTQVPRAVVDAMADYLFHHNANTHWAYPTSAETDIAIERAREASADLVNSKVSEIAFGANMTTLTFHLSRALGKDFGSGDEIVVTDLDHHANIDPWIRLEKERGVTVRKVRFNPETGQLDWDQFESFISPKTKVIAVGAASNALGTINDVPRAVSLARAVGALIFVDAVHYVPHALVDVRAWDCDFVGMSAYKFYGPHIGILYGKHELLSEIDFPKLIPAPDYSPERVETGTQNQEGMVGTHAAVDFLASFVTGGFRRESLANSYAEMHKRNSKLVSKLWDGLKDIRGVKLYGPKPTEPRTPTIGFTVDGVASTDVAKRLSEKGLFLSHGDFYAATVVETLGLGEEGLVRAGCACYTTEEEIERLLEGVEEIAGKN
jgi:cysteine desulfurase family protein (TIGR01976 family)